MSVAVGAKVALKVASLVGTTAGSGDDTALKTLLKAIAAVLISVLLLIAAVISILSSPFKFAGAVGDFQNNYIHLIPGVESGAAGGINQNPTHITPSIPIKNSEYAEYVDSITDPDRKAIIEAGFSLLGKVGYFWGGKSVAGWNNDWGKKKLVTSPGSKSSGTYRPYGLDCSGYVDWCYKTAGVGDMLSKGGTGWQWGQSYEITSGELQPGDLVFQHKGSSAANHVGLFLGVDENGKNLYLHCAGSSGVTLNSYSGFVYFRRVPILDKANNMAA
ncbi:MAG: NlpC/P60 family protein [Oscillospiraceae bacterium]